MLTKGNEIFDNSSLTEDPITFSIDSCVDEDKEMVCTHPNFDRGITGIR